MHRSIILSLRPLLLALAVTAIAVPAPAQQARLLAVEDEAYRYITRLQRRGHLLDLHPTALPYTRADVAAALGTLNEAELTDRERRWRDLIAATLQFREADESVVSGGSLALAWRATDTDRLDPLRPTEAGDPILATGAVRHFPYGTLNAYTAHRAWVAQLGLRFDQYYNDDPDGLDAVNRVEIRNEDSYIGYGSRLVGAYLGRFNHQWGVHDTPSTLLSPNPRSYDQLALRLGGRRLALRSILGELDSITSDGRFTGTAGADSVAGSERRYLSAHRLDWRPSRHLALTFMESTVYSGVGSGLSLKFLNPLGIHAFSVDNRPKNDENNGLVAGILWFYYRGLTIQGQLLLDDVNLLKETAEPSSIALTGSFHYAAAPAVDVSGTLAVISARVYNTHQPEGRYLFLQRGLASQFNDYVHAAAYADYYADAVAEGLTLTPRLDLLWQGERSISTPYPDDGSSVGFVATGTAERTVRASVQAFYQPRSWWWLRVDYGYNALQDAGHVPGRSSGRFVGLVEVGARLSLSGRYG